MKPSRTTSPYLSAEIQEQASEANVLWNQLVRLKNRIEIHGAAQTDHLNVALDALADTVHELRAAGAK